MQTRDWKRCHIDECTMLKAVRKSCPNQDSSFARLFVRNGLKTNVSVWFNYLTITTVNEFQKLAQELSPLCRMTWRHLVCHRFPASCQSWPQSSAGRPPSSWSTSHKIVVNCSKRGSLSSTLWINITITTYGISAASCTLWVSWSGYPCRCLTRAFITARRPSLTVVFWTRPCTILCVTPTLSLFPSSMPSMDPSSECKLSDYWKRVKEWVKYCLIKIPIKME